MKTITRSDIYLPMAAMILTAALAVSAAAQTPTFTTIDYPGSTATMAWGINTHGDIVGIYMLADKKWHGFLLSGGNYTPIDFPGSDNTQLQGINPAGAISGIYTTDTDHSFIMSGTIHPD